MRYTHALIPVVMSVFITPLGQAAPPLVVTPKEVKPNVTKHESITGQARWRLVWQDEFEGTQIDRQKWHLANNCFGGGNDEQQCYQDHPSNAFVSDGVLSIVARKQTVSGPQFAEGMTGYDANDSSKTQAYSSARLDSMHKGDWLYGRFEIRAKLPVGQGSWPAIWMLPTDWQYGPWAGSGEIDIMEAVNLTVSTAGSPPEDRVYGTLHYGAKAPGNVYSGAEYRLGNDASPSDDFHIYALEWEQDVIRWYVDGVHYATQTSAAWYSQYQDAQGQWQNAPDDAPFNQAFHLILNLAVGGNWAGKVNQTGVDDSVFPQAMLVDYVRVYECVGANDDSKGDGKGCGQYSADAKIVAGFPAPTLVH